MIQVVLVPFLGSLGGMYLLQLHILQVAPHHHFQDNKEFSITYVSISINIIDLKGKPQFLLLVSFGAEGAEARDEFLKIDITTAVFVEYSDHSAREEVH